MALHVNTFAALTDHFVNPFVRENVARVFEDVVRFTFKSLTLTPFRIEILSVRKRIFQCFNGVFSAILVRMRKRYARISLYFFFYNFCADIPCFFSRARSTYGEGGTRKYQPLYQPPYQPSK